MKQELKSDGEGLRNKSVVKTRQDYETHVSEEKITTVKQFIELCNTYNNIAVINLENLPSKQLQQIRVSLRKSALIVMTKKRLIKIILEEAKKQKPEIEKLISHLKGLSALLFTNESPFKLYNLVKKSKSKAPIKPGQITPIDLVVKEGKTNFPPGPLIGELGQLKIKTQITDGKVAIKEDVTVAHAGDVVNDKLASILQRLGIEPMEIGLDIIAVYENRDILTKDILDIDETKYFNNFRKAHANALAVAIEAGYPTKETLKILFAKAHMQALLLAIENNIPNKDTINYILAKANRQASLITAS